VGVISRGEGEGVSSLLLKRPLSLSQAAVAAHAWEEEEAANGGSKRAVRTGLNPAICRSGARPQLTAGKKTTQARNLAAPPLQPREEEDEL
jgi:hypothetical protein